jgi:plastocyanin
MHGDPKRQRSRRCVVVAASAITLLVALGACSSSDSGSSTPESRAGSSSSGAAKPGADDAIDIELVAYDPKQLTVDAGTTVTWHQRDPGSHTVTSGTVEQGTGSVATNPDGKFSSGELTTDESFEFAFAEPGTYPYFCEIHPATMRGEITVR